MRSHRDTTYPIHYTIYTTCYTSLNKDKQNLSPPDINRPSLGCRRHMGSVVYCTNAGKKKRQRSTLQQYIISRRQFHFSVLCVLIFKSINVFFIIYFCTYIHNNNTVNYSTVKYLYPDISLLQNVNLLYIFM